MPDQDLIDNVKLAKGGKQMHFVLIEANATHGKLILSKTKIAPALVTLAKKQCGGNTTIQGTCIGHDGGLTFETERPAPQTAKELAHHLIKTEAGMQIECDFTVPSQDGSTQTGTTTTPPQQGSTPPNRPQPQIPPRQQTTTTQTGTQPEQQHTVSQEVAELFNGLKDRVMAVGEWMKHVKVERPDVYQRVEGSFRESAEHLKGHRFQECETILAKLEQIVEKFNSQVQHTTNTGNQPQTPPTQSQTPPQDTGVQQQDTTNVQTPPQDTGGQTGPVLGRPRGGSLPPTPPPRQRAQTMTGNIPDTPATRANNNFNNAKRQVETFKGNRNAGYSTVQGRQKIETLKNEMLTLVNGELDSEDDIKRKGLLFDSIDANYKKNVMAVVKQTMQAVQPHLEDPTQNPSEPITALDEGMAALAKARLHYADVKGITDRKHLEQRQKKVEAIDSHLAEMKKIADKFRGVLKVKMQPVLDMLTAASDLKDKDLVAYQQAMKDFGKELNQDEDLRKGFFQTVGPEHSDLLLDAIEDQEITARDKLCRELAVSRAGDSAFMDVICERAVKREGAKATDKGTFFRGTSLASKLTAIYASNSPGGKAFCGRVNDTVAEKFKGKGPMEIDKNKDDKLTDKDIQKNIQSQNQMLGSLIDDLFSDPSSVPPEIAKIAKTYYDEAMRVGGNDDDFATTQIGGFVMLRMLSVSIADNAARRTNDQKSESDKKKFAKDQRLATLQTKILQNMSNGVEFGEKESYMVPFNNQIKVQNGGYTPLTQKMRGFMKGIVTNAPN